MRLESWLYTLPLRVRSLFRRRQVERELSEELQFHLERQIEAEIAKGRTPEEARYVALRAVGGLDQRGTSEVHSAGGCCGSAHFTSFKSSTQMA